MKVPSVPFADGAMGPSHPRRRWREGDRPRGTPSRRPGRRQHDALDALFVGLTTRKVNWVLDADIRGFFDTIAHESLLKFTEHRIADPRVLRLIRKWLRAGVSEDGNLVPGAGRHASRSGNIAAAWQRVPALRPGPVGTPMALSPCSRRCDHCPLR